MTSKVIRGLKISKGISISLSLSFSYSLSMPLYLFSLSRSSFLFFPAPTPTLALFPPYASLSFLSLLFFSSLFLTLTYVLMDNFLSLFYFMFYCPISYLKSSITKKCLKKVVQLLLLSVFILCPVFFLAK